MSEAVNIWGRIRGPSVTYNLEACSVSCSNPGLLQSPPSEGLGWDWGSHAQVWVPLWAHLEEEQVKSLAQTSQYRKGSNLHAVSSMMWRRRTSYCPNTPSKTFRLLQVFKFSLIWQDWFSTLYFVKSIVKQRQVKLISTHFPPHPRPLCSLLAICDFSSFCALLKSLVFWSTVKSEGSTGMCGNFNVMF